MCDLFKYAEIDSTVYEGESVNRSQMDIKRKILIFKPGEKRSISRHIFHQQ
jgi:hypothetical protein